MYASFPTQYVTKPMSTHAFGLLKSQGHAMVLAQWKLFYVKEFLISILITVKLFVILYWENSHIFRGIYFTRLCFKLNNWTGQKFGMSELAD